MIIIGIRIYKSLIHQLKRVSTLQTQFRFQCHYPQPFLEHSSISGKIVISLGIRHTVRPTISFSYSPDLSKSYYKNVQYTPEGNFQNINLFDGNVYSAFTPGTFGGVSFGIDNNIEAKVKSKTDTSSGANEKVKLIDGFGFNGSYNYLADSFKLSPIYFYLRSTLAKKINISASTTLNPLSA